MRHRSGRILSVVWGVAVTVLVLGNAQFALQGSGNSQPSATQTTDKKFKNIQVLKGIPADQLIPAMQFITASLGVDCSFCHVENHFDQDDKKPKRMARKMMQMMAAINEQNFDNHRE